MPCVLWPGYRSIVNSEVECRSLLSCMHLASRTYLETVCAGRAIGRAPRSAEITAICTWCMYNVSVFEELRTLTRIKLLVMDLTDLDSCMELIPFANMMATLSNFDKVRPRKRLYTMDMLLYLHALVSE